MPAPAPTPTPTPAPAETAWMQPLIDAIPRRRSVRNYQPDALPPETLQQITQFIDELNTKLPFAHDTKIQVFQAEPQSGLYNNGTNPVNNIAFLSQTDLVSTSKTGFVGELVMLYAVSLGLETCWYGHYMLAEVGRYIDGIATPERLAEAVNGAGYGWNTDIGERVVVCMPFGHVDAEADAQLQAARGPRPRVPLAELMTDPDLLTSIPADILAILDLGRQAPSGGNGQMWRFDVDLDFSKISVAKEHGYVHPRWEHPDVDIGISAAHLWLGFSAKGYEPDVSVSLDDDRAIWTFTIRAAELF